MGRHQPGSDIDLCLEGQQISHQDLLRLLAPWAHAHHHWIGSDRGRYGDRSKQCSHCRGAIPVAGSIWPGGSGGRQLGGPDHLLHLLEPCQHPLTCQHRD